MIPHILYIYINETFLEYNTLIIELCHDSASIEGELVESDVIFYFCPQFTAIVLQLFATSLLKCYSFMQHHESIARNIRYFWFVIM